MISSIFPSFLLPVWIFEIFLLSNFEALDIGPTLPILTLAQPIVIMIALLAFLRGRGPEVLGPSSRVQKKQNYFIHNKRISEINV